MEASLKQVGDVSVIVIKGQLEIEKAQNFKQVCLKHFKGKPVAFNLESANFVGSTGIQSFLETVETLTSGEGAKVTIVGAKSEFRRILENMQSAGLFFVDSENQLAPQDVDQNGRPTLL